MTFNLLSIVAGIGYIVVGIFVMMYKFFIIPLENNIAYALGALLILYGAFRLVRVISRMRSKGDE